MNERRNQMLVLGIGNVLMGDEGVGVAVVRALEADGGLPPGVVCLDGGTGSFSLLPALREAGRVIMIDATIDGRPAGTIDRLEPRFSKDYPRSLTAHDIGLRDLLDSFHILGDPPPVALYTVSIAGIRELGLELSPPVAAAVPLMVGLIRRELGGAASAL